MNKSVFIASVVVILAFVLCTEAQQGVSVTAVPWFTSVTGSSVSYLCRPADEVVYGGPTQQTCQSLSFATPPNSQSRWGNPASGNGRSGLGFAGVSNKIVAVGSDFFLGSLTHFNFPITNAANGVTLNIYFKVTTEDGSTTIGTNVYNFPLTIDETTNDARGFPGGVCPYPGVTPCSDKITFTSPASTQSFTIGSVDYTLQLVGFKESNSSTSNPVTSFISEENNKSQAYLFARITAACPRTCVNGGSYIITSNKDCICNCASVTCSTGKTTSPNCTCVCPDLNKCKNGGYVDTNNGCNCVCPACASPLILNSVDCGCSCPSGYCGAGTIADPNTCSCNCPDTCSTPNEVRDSRCNCVCDLTCPALKMENPDPKICGCICKNSTCNEGYTMNTDTCQCTCTRTCPNGQPLNAATCTCGNCVGNWTKDSQGYCNQCGLTSTSCRVGETVNTDACKCVCNALVCDLYNNGEVVDTSADCACRKCLPGECYCGNGKVEPGEDCDIGNSTDPCCQECKWTTSPCDDKNGCTSGDTCNGNGTCKGDYKCAKSGVCHNITCDPLVGICQQINFANGSICSSDRADLCQYRCIAGACQNKTVVCPTDTNSTDCFAPKCNSLTGTCPIVAVANGTACSDGNPCTLSDYCSTNGTCSGTPIVCKQDPLKPCQNFVCSIGNCIAIKLTGPSCDADGSLCTVGDQCVAGRCTPGDAVQCNNTNPCKNAYCNATTGSCYTVNLPNLNYTCIDDNICTSNDRCIDGQCIGDIDQGLANSLEACGYVPPTTPQQTNNTSIIIFSVAGAAALIGAIAGAAFLIKKIRDSKLMDPDTWNPDTFSSVGANPLYQGSEKTVDNRMYESSM